jgi:ABC-2 type transport system permease protein
VSALRSAVSAEWTKLWTTRTVWWALVAAVLLMAAGAGQYAIYAQNGDLSKDLLESNGLIGAGTIAVMGVALAQFAVIALGTLVMTSEYSSGLIRATLAWVPSRGRVIVAKGTVVAAVIVILGFLLGLLGAGLAIPLLGDKGDAQAPGILGDALAIGGYLALIAVFAMGLGAALRGPVASLISVFMLLVVIPPILTIPDNSFLNHVNDALPGVAGDHFLRGDTHPYPPAAGLLIVAGWAAATLIAGWFVMRRKDA